MDTAPKDGTKFLAFVDSCLGGFQVVVKYHQISESFVVAWNHDEINKLIYWRPLPKPPKDLLKTQKEKESF
jgi:hypothetical protein